MARSLLDEFLRMASTAAGVFAQQLEAEIAELARQRGLNPAGTAQNQGRRGRGRVGEPGNPSAGAQRRTGKAGERPRKPEPVPVTPLPGFSAVDTAYAVLGVGAGWDRVAVRKHYLSLISADGVSVDKGGDPVRAAMVNAAYQEVCRVRGWKK